MPERILVFVLAGLCVVLTILLLRTRRSRKLEKIAKAAFPPEPLNFLTLLKGMESMVPHCLWSGSNGELWGVYLNRHKLQLPFAQEGREVWFNHLKGNDVEVDTGVKALTLEEGQWMKLPGGVGPGGIRSSGAFILYSIAPKS